MWGSPEVVEAEPAVKRFVRERQKPGLFKSTAVSERERKRGKDISIGNLLVRIH